MNRGFDMKKKFSFFKKEPKKKINHVQNTYDYGNISKNVKENIDRVKTILGNSTDIITREFSIGESGKIKIGIIYTDGLANQDFIQHYILKTLMHDIRTTNIDKNIASKNNIYEILRDFVLTSCDLDEIYDLNEVLSHILEGDTVILIDGYSKGFTSCTRGWEDRGVTEPSSQTVVRGPKDGFSETIRTNTALIRRRIRDPNLWIETKHIGRRTKTEVAIAYIKGVANDEIVKEVYTRLERIDIDGILESAYIEELIEDNIYSPFPTILNTERPDIVSAALLEGRIAILVDGTPFVLIVPSLFIHFLHSSEDYYARFEISSLLRLLRYLGLFLALLSPSLYIAITTFHQEMIPTTLLINLAAQREGVPFPAFFEALIMEVTFELLREAGIRLPKAIGSAISIVGALVLGEAATKAGIVSPAMVIVVSITAISNFSFPNYNISISIRMLRFVFMILASTFGLYGISLGLIVLVLHLCSLRSFGIPYFAPIGPYIKKDRKDAIIRLPRHMLTTRPSLISQTNIFRQQNSSSAKPQPPKKDN